MKLFSKALEQGDRLMALQAGLVHGKIGRRAFIQMAVAAGALRANKRETTDWLKFTLEGAGERTHGYAFTDTTFAGCWI
jgi:hypothetical protein